MRNLVNVSNVEKFQSLQAIVNDTAPFIVKGLIARMQQKKPELIIALIMMIRPPLSWLANCWEV